MRDHEDDRRLVAKTAESMFFTKVLDCDAVSFNVNSQGAFTDNLQ